MITVKQIQELSPEQEFVSNVFNATIIIESAAIAKISDEGYVTAKVVARKAYFNKKYCLVSAHKNKVCTCADKNPLEMFGNTFLFYSNDANEVCSWTKKV
jgi:hypothetical protein